MTEEKVAENLEQAANTDVSIACDKATDTPKRSKKDKKAIAEMLLSWLLNEDQEPQEFEPVRPLEEIVCVFGCQGAGKSTYIAEHYEIGKGADDIIDIYQYQNGDAYPQLPGMPSHMMQTRLSYALFEMDVHNAIEHAKKHGSNTGRLVLEGTFMRSARRAPVLQTIKNVVDPRCAVKCIWIEDQDRYSHYMAYDGATVFDAPSKDEGFTEVVIIDKKDRFIEDAQRLTELRDKVEVQKARDRITESDMLGYRVLAEEAGRAMHKSLVGDRDDQGRLTDTRWVHAGCTEGEILMQQGKIAHMKREARIDRTDERTASAGDATEGDAAK